MFVKSVRLESLKPFRCWCSHSVDLHEIYLDRPERCTVPLCTCKMFVSQLMKESAFRRQSLSQARKEMKNLLRVASFAILIPLLFPQFANAQATPISKIGIDQPATDVATATSYTYKYYEGVNAGVVLTGTVCVGIVSPFQCSFTFPAFTPGSHTVTITASNVAGESPKSAPLTFTFTVIPSTPLNPRVQ